MTTQSPDAADAALTVSPSQAKRCIVKAIKAKKVPMLHGSPGIGKSDIMRAIAREHNLLLIDERLSQCDPTDLKGFPSVVNGRSTFLAMDTFPLQGDPLPINPETKQPYAGWLLFLDEINSAKDDIQAAAYKLILDRMVGPRPIHERCAIVSAGNLEGDNAIVHTMSTALRSRILHLVLRLDEKEWLSWAMDNQFDHRITDYVQFKPAALYMFDPDSADLTYPCPRTWHFTQDVLKACDSNVKDPDFLFLASGCITEGVTREFLIFCEIYANLPKISDIMMNPKGHSMPNEPSILFALSGSIGTQATTSNIDKLMPFVLRMQLEFQVVTLRYIVKRNKQMLADPSVAKWVSEYGAELF
jgi:hypothetical protein